MSLTPWDGITFLILCRGVVSLLHFGIGLSHRSSPPPLVCFSIECRGTYNGREGVAPRRSTFNAILWPLHWPLTIASWVGHI
jgi:hypothetical protein